MFIEFIRFAKIRSFDTVLFEYMVSKAILAIEKKRRMKKILLLALMTGFLASCKKDYTCECVALGVTLSNNSIGKLSKKDADKTCNGNDNATLGIDCTAIEK